MTDYVTTERQDCIIFRYKFYDSSEEELISQFILNQQENLRGKHGLGGWKGIACLELGKGQSF